MSENKNWKDMDIQNKKQVKEKDQRIDNLKQIVADMEKQQLQTESELTETMNLVKELEEKHKKDSREEKSRKQLQRELIEALESH